MNRLWRNHILLVRCFGLLLVAIATLNADPGAAPFVETGLAKDAKIEDTEQKGFEWGPALRDSFRFLAVQHAFRIATEEDTVRELGGPFFKDYWRSVKGIGQWDDGDEFYVNYVGHPMQGAVSGYIAVHNDPLYRRAEYGDQGYWRSRLRATGFSALHSVMFEIGPFSEATIGNVGKAPGTGGIVDFVVTPLGGLGVMVLEDSIDRYVIRRLERWNSNRVFLALYRTTLNPSRTFANVMGMRLPWHRDRTRELFRGSTESRPARDSIRK